MAMAVCIVLRIPRRAHASARARASVYAPWPPDAACAPSPRRRLRDFPLRVRVHNDVSGLRERNFGKSRR